MIAEDISSWAPTKYKTKNWSSYNDSLKQRGSLSIWFDLEMVWAPPPNGKRGRQQQFSDAASADVSDVEGPAWHAASADNWVRPEPVTIGRAGLDRAGFQHLMSSVARQAIAKQSAERGQRTLNVGLSYRGSKGPLHLLIDSTDIKAEGESEWNARKHGGPKRRIWRKIHIGIEEETLEVRTVEVTSSNVGDAPMLRELLNQIPPDQDIGSVTADGAYDTRKCHEAIATRGTSAVIPPRKNAKPCKPTSAGAIARNEAVSAQQYLGRTLRRRWSGYHRRSRVETKMHCMKLLGQSLMARDFDWQVAEIHVRIAVLNRYTALGIPVTEPVG